MVRMGPTFVLTLQKGLLLVLRAYVHLASKFHPKTMGAADRENAKDRT
jgi:hypothetical protein